MVDPDDEIDESNENNNVIWAYFKMFSPGIFPQRTSDWHQVSKIPGSMPLNIPNSKITHLIKKIILNV